MLRDLNIQIHPIVNSLYYQLIINHNTLRGQRVARVAEQIEIYTADP